MTALCGTRNTLMNLLDRHGSCTRRCSVSELFCRVFKIVKFGLCRGLIIRNLMENILVYLIKPAHQYNDGYVIQWVRAANPLHMSAMLNGLFSDPIRRQNFVLANDIVVYSVDEANARLIKIWRAVAEIVVFDLVTKAVNRFRFLIGGAKSDPNDRFELYHR
ncbi:hypothetical protein OAJ57_01650 [Alphaproteobacteria bacterium]|nr:hypothetical protein [Alphaproteobacteria bacterium]